jgi:alkyl sulfatase BDS1-like metallo-beta-lactamase superfamily hydrolase
MHPSPTPQVHRVGILISFTHAIKTHNHKKMVVGLPAENSAPFSYASDFDAAQTGYLAHKLPRQKWLII